MNDLLTQFQRTLVRQIVSTQHTASALPALAVYKNNFIENGIRALAVSFSTLSSILGEQDFRRLAASYLNQVAKTEFDWADFGSEMREFILLNEISQDLPYLSEIADFDWKKQESERAEDTCFDADSFSLLSLTPASKLRFRVNNSAKLCAYYFPMPLFRQLALTPETSTHKKERNEILNALKKAINDAINLEKPRSYIVWRAEFKAEITPIDELSHNAFNAMLRQQSVEQVLACFGDSSERMSQWLEDCIAKQMICAVEYITV